MKIYVLLIILPFILVGCISSYTAQSNLATINIVDHNGFSETISTTERLNQYQNLDYTQTLPYQKVLRVYKRNYQGDIKSILTHYYANGQVKQYLEIVNGRAYGTYREWHQNGHLKLDAVVIGGNPDIDSVTEGGWLFDGISRAWDEDENLIAEIPYNKGEFQGEAHYYHQDGKLWKSIPYHKNQIEGTAYVYKNDGTLLQNTEFSESFNHGKATRYWSPEKVASQEIYQHGNLQTGQYYDLNHNKIAEVSNGDGIRAVFSKHGIAELQEYKEGVPNGEIKVFGDSGRLVGTYYVKEHVKEGIEIVYYDTLLDQQPKLSVEWHNDLIRGTIKTWYKNGTQESQREMHNNIKSGLSTAWYYDGSFMLIEEYQNDKLVKGQYFAKGDSAPVSKVNHGSGVATLYDPEGTYIARVNYKNGVPIDDEE